MPDLQRTPYTSGVYTYATLPAASAHPPSGPSCTYAHTTDQGLVYSDGFNWNVPGGYRALGQVATGCVVPVKVDTTNKQRMSRTEHVARDTITSLRLGFANWYVASFDAPTNGTEAVIGSASSDIQASIEYPVGVFTRVRYSGGDQGSIGSGTTLISDELRINIPNGAKFWVRNWQNNSDGLARAESGFAGNMNHGVTTTNLVMSGTVTANPGYGIPPVAIIGPTNRPILAIVGDSIPAGAGENTAPLNSGYKGWVSRIAGPSYGTINLAATGDRAAWAVSNYTKRGALLQYCTHVICTYGINDIAGGGGASSANLLTFLTNLFARSEFTGKVIYQATIIPKTLTTSESDYATDVGQDTHTTNATRVTFNTALHAFGLPVVDGILDVAQIVESPTKTGVWVAADGVALTTDGTHPNARGHMKIQSQLVFPNLRR